MPLTDQQRKIVTESFARLVPVSTEATRFFYERLEIAPETRSMFDSTDMTEQGLKLMRTLGMSVRGLYDLNEITLMLHELGERHIGYGVTKDQYDFVKVALIDMIQYCLGKEFTPELHDAWVAAYDLITSIIVSVYD